MDTAATLRTDFATRLYSKLAATQDGKNLFLSPFSIQVALAMCAVGARGETRRVMADLIGAPDSVDEQNHQFAKLVKSVLGEEDRPFQLDTANALWAQQGFHFRPDFRKAVADFYRGAFNEVDFVSHLNDTLKTINTWVSEKTHEKIRELVTREDIQKDTRLILTNAIYFKGKWEKEFQKSNTTDENWDGPYGSKEVPTMHQKTGYLYHEDDQFEALDLPYKGGQLSMLIVLPRKKDGLNVLEKQWALGPSYRQVTNQLKQETVILSLPRFKMETAFKLKPVLCDLGAKLAFSSSADFSGIGDEPLMIAEVIHKAFVEVNEEGTEAAAATAVLMTRAAARTRTEPKVFKADHPFLFFIRDRRNNAVLFSGRVLDPA
jgi:serpin B